MHKSAAARNTHPEVQPETFTEEEIEKQLHYASRRERRLIRKDNKRKVK
jgi:hypothetical protein